MSDYGEYQDGGEILEDRMPSSVVREMPEYLSEPYKELDEGINKLKNRLEQCMQFVETTAAKGICRCSFYKDPNCVVCMAKNMLSQWQHESSAQEVT